MTLLERVGIVLLMGNLFSAGKLVFYDTDTNLPVACKVAKSESYDPITEFLEELKTLGFQPVSLTSDGKGTIKKTFCEIWPGITYQRCLFHIKLQTNAWVRIPPRTPFGHALHDLVDGLMYIITPEQALRFRLDWDNIKTRYADHIRFCRINKETNNLARAELKALALIDNALNDMFTYLEYPETSKTISGLEGFNKQIERIRSYDHPGLTQKHTSQFLPWYTWLKHQK